MAAKVVSFSGDIEEVHCSQDVHVCEGNFDSEDDFCESTSGEDSSSDERDGEFLEQILDGVYSSRYSPSKPLDPVERDSLLIFDKDFFYEEELYLEGRVCYCFHSGLIG